MSRRHPIPSYRLHKFSGQAVVTLRDHLGQRKDRLLGVYGSDESKAAYGRIIAEWQSSRGAAPVTGKPTTLTVDDVILRFWNHAKEHYRYPDGRPTSELHLFSRSTKELRELYGTTPAAEFGPLALKAVRRRMIDTPLQRDEETTLCRRTINKFIDHIRMIFRWAASEQLVPVSVYEALKTVSGLQRGRTNARELEPVKPIPEAHIDGVLDHVSRTVRGMIQLQLATAMRPGELCSLRVCDLDTSGAVWLYRPASHKTAWRGKDRVICLGPRAVAIVKEFLTTDMRAFLFSPKVEQAERFAELRANRRSPVQPSQECRKKPDAQRVPRECYTPDTYARAVRRGIDRANESLRREAKREGRKIEEHELIPYWSPNRIRHTAATMIRKEFGLEASRTILGHSDASTTSLYAARDMEAATRVAAAIG